MTLLKWISTKSIFKRIFDLVVSGTDIQHKAMRLFIFKTKALYFFSQLLCSTVFEHDKHVMIIMLNNQMEDICFESIHDDMIKRKRKLNKRIDEISSGFIEI